MSRATAVLEKIRNNNEGAKKLLQVKTGDDWKYVFARIPGKKDPATTDKKHNAQPASALKYFQSKFANHLFRVV